MDISYHTGHKVKRGNVFSWIGMICAIGLVIMLANNCGNQPPCSSYHFHKSFPHEYEGAAWYAVEKWNSFSGDAIGIDTAGDNNDEICSFRGVAWHGPEYEGIKKDLNNVDFFGANLRTDGSIVIVPEAWYAVNGNCREDMQLCARGILMHELGHEYGMMHITFPESIMNPGEPETHDKYNEGDEIECKRVEACK